LNILAGDIGGTKTTLAVFEVHGSKFSPLVEKSYSSQQYPSFNELLQVFVEAQTPHFHASCFGIAGPVRNGIGQLTNLPWTIDTKELGKQLNTTNTWLLNDLAANAWGLNTLQPTDFVTLNAGQNHYQGNCSMISAGTGLGEAGMFWDGQNYQPFASEGGHTNYAPTNELEIHLLQYMLKRQQHVSWEHLVSGPGLLNIYHFLCEFRNHHTPKWLGTHLQTSDPAAAISQAAIKEKCPVCTEALTLFVRLYGIEAGNHALKIMATGGVYIGGGIAPKILAQLEKGGFLEAFFAKGSMETLMRNIPVTIVMNEATALRGAAYYAALQHQP
jgi:glucokinase